MTDVRTLGHYLTALLMLCCLSACERGTNAQNTTSAAKTAKTQPAKSQSSAMHSTSSPRGTTTQPARLVAWEQTPIYAKVTGYVQSIRVDIGDAIVDTSKPLVMLRIPEMQDEVQQKLALEAQAEADVKQAKAAIAMAESRKQTADARVAEALAGLDRFSAATKRWNSELTRLTNLAKDGSVSEKLVDEAQFEKDSADAALKEAKAKVQSAKAARSEAAAAVTKAKADASAAAARVKVAVANRKYSQTMLKYAEIKAPFSGVVVERNVDTGHFVQPGDAAKSKPLLVVAMIKRLRVVVEVPEADATFVSRGNNVTIRVPALGMKGVVSGKVSRTGFALNPRNRTLRVEIEIPNTAGSLRPGMYATATIDLEASPELK